MIPPLFCENKVLMVLGLLPFVVSKEKNSLGTYNLQVKWSLTWQNHHDFVHKQPY